jgi:hypothetical protein
MSRRLWRALSGRRDKYSTSAQRSGQAARTLGSIPPYWKRDKIIRWQQIAKPDRVFSMMIPGPNRAPRNAGRCGPRETILCPVRKSLVPDGDRPDLIGAEVRCRAGSCSKSSKPLRGSIPFISVVRYRNATLVARLKWKLSVLTCYRNFRKSSLVIRSSVSGGV